MKKMLVMSSLVFASALHTIAVEAGIGTNKKANNNSATVAADKKSGETKAAPAPKKMLSASQRANYLTDQMIRELKLNNYQARTLRAINLDKVTRMMAIEAKGGDPNQIDNDCKGVCKDRDKELENLLSTEQYSKYYGNRPNYYKLDKDYAMGGYLSQPTAKVEKDNLADNDDDATLSAGNQMASR
ncbi:hypothetical protein [Adhaeribacter soli]|uniref:DUF4890 domain-containing protein n=1 Tax=Adhaeribacter soli TaxID=2607655 RepID=A0A5N1J4F0_9BACT|nr:hypothetical protein [Adhaeribacter soli]KAA9345786.1 hypothetical protein F0P94_01495 [Adhaeribacter soli]